MEFKPLYYADRIKLYTPEDRQFEKEKLNLINPEGHSSIVTLWQNPAAVWNKLLKKYSRLFGKDSPLVTLTSLYGNGIPQMLANLAHNPQIERIGVTGSDKDSVPSSTYLFNFLDKGVENSGNSEDKMAKIVEVEYYLDAQLRPEMFGHLRVQRFKPTDLEGLVNFVSQPPVRKPVESERTAIKLQEPEFTDFPSDITSHRIRAKTPLDAWMEVMYTLDRFGENIKIKKGERRTLYNLGVHVSNPDPEDPEKLREFGFDPKELEAYRKEILDSSEPEGDYSYGHRLRTYFGYDQLDEIITRFRADPQDRRAYASTWDSSKDLLSKGSKDSSVPCLTDLYFTNRPSGLHMRANFRTHNATSAWLKNLYGLRSIQEYIAQGIGIEPGGINVNSRQIGIDLKDPSITKPLKTVEERRKIKTDLKDPRGFFIVGVRDKEIFAEHYSPNASKLRTYTAKTAQQIKDQLRQDSVLDSPDHAMYVGYELAKAHNKLHGEIPEI